MLPTSHSAQPGRGVHTCPCQAPHGALACWPEPTCLRTGQGVGPELNDLSPSPRFFKVKCRHKQSPPPGSGGAGHLEAWQPPADLRPRGGKEAGQRMQPEQRWEQRGQGRGQHSGPGSTLPPSSWYRINLPIHLPSVSVNSSCLSITSSQENST